MDPARRLGVFSRGGSRRALDPARKEADGKNEGTKEDIVQPRLRDPGDS